MAGSGSLDPDVSNIQSPDWSVGGDLAVGEAGAGTLVIDAGGSVSDVGDAYIGNHSQGEVTVQGSSAGGQASSLAISGQTMIGVEGGSTGSLDILDGGVVTSAGAVLLGRDGGSAGSVLVSGPGATWTHASTETFQVGAGGSGTLRIDNGGAVHSGQGVVGADSGSDGHVIVSGPGSVWDPVGNIYVGLDGTGELAIQDGATVSTVGPAGPTSAAAIYIGQGTGSSGTVTVSSSTADISTLRASDVIQVAIDGTGSLTIAKGGVAMAGSDTYIAIGNGAAGTLTLNGDATGRGVLETGSVIKGAGTAVLILDGGILRANRDEADFLHDFVTQAVGTEGAWFDTNAHDVAIGTAFTGTSSFNKLGAGTLTLTGNSSAFTGNTEVLAGTLQVDGVLGGPAHVAAGARLTGTGQVGPTDNHGTIAPGPRSGFGTLTVAGDYRALGGNLQIRTQLGDDSSPTDLLVIQGSTAGTTPVEVINVGGLGAQTVNGIRVVQVDGVSAGQFDLANGDYTIGGQPALVAGAYGYVLQQDATDGDWYLRSSLLAAGGTPDGSDGPLYQPGVPVYEAYANTLQSLSRLPTLRQRVGNRLYDAADTGREGVWGRVEGTASHLEPATSTTGARQDIDSWKAQFGVDHILAGGQDGSRLVGGLTVHYGTADTRVSSVYGDGSINTRAYGLGPTLTWYGKDGTYVDAQAQATWFDSDLNSRPAGKLADGRDAHSYGLSIETGKSFPLAQGFAVIPQAQLSYVATRFNRFDDRFGARVDSDKGNSLQGRLGVALDYQRRWSDAGGRAHEASVYGVFNVRRELLDGARVLVSGVPFESRQRRTWGGVGIGGNYGWADRYAIYGEVAADTDFSGSYVLTATAGFRMMF